MAFRNPFGNKPNPFGSKPSKLSNSPLRNKSTESATETKRKIQQPRLETEKQKILREYGGLESNIPVNSAYWRMRR